ncbi:unnamed protein product [Blepharisma stoltei]|uniref:Uncharacterized protein n=1 Tax=Blepharisma stoltei TaxID=1481888 RepID=A0AAU9IM50_9CILI|nr:unnamed protein product [Blepharisma stoltei]
MDALLSDNQSLDENENRIEPLNIYYPGGQKIYSYNVDLRIKTEKRVLEPNLLISCVSPIDSHILFCIGYIKSMIKVWGISFVFDYSEGKTSLMSHNAPVYITNCTFFNKEIFTFGGFEVVSPKYATKYDFKTNEWRSLANLPKLSDFCNSIEFKGKILVAGRSHRWLCVYDPAIDSYSLVYGFHRTHKILMKVDNRVYVLETEGGLFESSLGDIYNWQNVSKDCCIGCNSFSYCLKLKSGIYFIVNEQELWEFDFKKKVTKSIALVS